MHKARYDRAQLNSAILWGLTEDDESAAVALGKAEGFLNRAEQDLRVENWPFFEAAMNRAEEILKAVARDVFAVSA